jgi:prolipoprotein diacylglyceryltransferase
VAVASDPSLSGFLLAGGRSILGGLAGAYAGVLLTKRLIGYREPTGDAFAPAVALGMAIGRFGCFFTELPGTPTRLPWAVTFYDGVPRHPSFLYEIVFQLGAFALLWWLRPRVHTKGDLFKIYLLGYAAFRFAVEFVRGNDVVWNGLTRPQLFLIPATLALMWYFARRRLSGANRPALVEGALS